MDLQNWLNLAGLVFNILGSLYFITVTYNPSELEKGKPIMWAPKSNKEGSINYKVGWSQFGKKVAVGIIIMVIGYLLQISAIFVNN